MGAIIPARRPYNDVSDCSKSLLRFPVSRFVAILRITEKISSSSRKIGLEGIIARQKAAFSEKGLKEAIHRLKPFFTDKSPFENPPRIPEKIQWVKPAFVCEVAFAEWT
jgi:hypothetical protein